MLITKGSPPSRKSPARNNVVTSHKESKLSDEAGVGFSSTDERPCLREEQYGYIPNIGPGDINLENEASSMIGKLRKKGEIGTKGVFGSTTRRFYRSPLHKGGKETSSLPGKFSYEN